MRLLAAKLLGRGLGLLRILIPVLPKTRALGVVAIRNLHDVFPFIV